MNLKDLIGFKDRNFGFYVNLGLSVLLLITGILYVANAQTNFYSVYALLPLNVAVAVLLFVGAFLTALLTLHKKTTVFAPFVGLVAILTAFCLHVEDVYLFIMNCFVDIDFHPEDFYRGEFLSTLVFMVIALITSVVACFLPQLKVNKENEEAKQEINEAKEAASNE